MPSAPGNRSYLPPADGTAASRAGSDSRPSMTSGRADRGEAPALPDARSLRHGTWFAIKHHRANSERLCDPCALMQREYNREYARLRLASDVFRARRNAQKRQRDRRIYADPQRVASINEKRRRYHQEARARLHAEARLDEVVVERLVNGEDVPHNRTEKVEALRRLIARGLSVSAAAQHLGINGQYARKYADLIEQGDVA